MPALQTPEHVDFSAVTTGDRIRFTTNDNGYGGRGHYQRSGKVSGTTDQTVTVACDDGSTAVLRRADWRARSVLRTYRAPANPYDADHVATVDDGRIVTAVWVSDPTVRPEEALENILDRDLPYEVEIIAEATRYYRKEGAGFSGWVVSSHGGLEYGDPIPNKPEALEALDDTVREVFERRSATK